MKKLLILLFFLVTTLFSTKIENFKVSYDPDYAPYTYNVDGKPYGLFIDIFKKWAKLNSYRLEFIDANTWDNAIELAKDGKVDFFIGTDPYEDWMKSSKPYYETKTALFSLNSQIESFNKIGIIGEDLKDDIVEEFPLIEVVSYDTYLQLLNGLLEKKLDAIYDDSIALNDFILKQNKSHLIKKLNIISNSSEISAISNDQKKVDIFTKGFEKLNKGQLIVLENNWIFNEDQKYFNTKENIDDIFLDDEKQWMRENPIVKFAVMSYWPHNEDGESFHTAMLKLINKHIGTNFIPIKYDTWSDGYGIAKEGVDLHGIMGLSYSKEREENYFYYTPAYHFSPAYIVVRDTNKDIKDIKDLEGKTIYLKTKSISHKIVQTNLKDIKVIDLSTIDEMYKNLSTSTKVDAFISYFADKELIEKYNLKIVKTIYEKYGETSIGVSHKYPHLASIIKKAYDIIPSKEIAKIRDKKWEKAKADQSSLNEKQIKYLQNKKVLKICTNPNWAPIEFTEDEDIKGISIDILTFIQDTMDLKYQFIKTTSWSQSQEFLKDKKCDILPSATKTKKREKYANFTKPYLNYDLAIITKDDKPLSQNIDAFLDKTMSRKKGSGLIAKIKSTYPTIDIKETSSTKESFDAVLDGDVDFTIATLPVLQYYKSKFGLKGLQVSGYTKMKYNISMAIRDDEPMLVDIINISLDKLSPQTYKIVHDKWASVKVVKQTNWILILEVGTVILLIILFILWNNRKLKFMVDEKTADIKKQKNELELMISSFDKNVIFSKTDLKGNITHVSDAFCKISGYSYDELIGKPHNIVRHPDMKSEVFKEIWESLKSEACIKAEVKNRRKDGSGYWVESKFEVDYDSEGNIIGYSALRVDITAKKEVQQLSENLEIKVEERTKELSDERKFIDSVMNSQSSIVITTDGKSIKSANKAFLDFFSVKDTQEFLETYGNCICDTFDTQAPKEFIQKTIDGVKWVDYIRENPDHTNKAMIDKGGKKHIFSINADSFVFNDAVLNTVVFNDITELEKIREDIEVSKKSTEEILANILLPVLITSKKRRVIVYANQFAQELYESSQEDLVDKQLDSIYTLTNGPQEIIRQITEYGRVESIEEHITTHTGKEFIGLLSVTPIVYNNEECYIGMTVDITKQKDMENEVRAIHKHTRDSIEYASLIQGSLIPDPLLLSQYFKDNFVHWLPKDTVGGDIWLFSQLRTEDECLLFFIDCTGHGVPGAFVTMIVKAIEREIITKIKDDKDMDLSPAWVMGYFNKTMKLLLKQETKDSNSNAGWDGGIIYYNKKDKILKFSGAETALFYVDTRGEFHTVKGNRYSVGYKKCDINYEYKETVLEVEDGMKFYCTTDGYLDQNGGEKDFPFGKKRFGNIIKEHHTKPMSEQKKIFLDEMERYESMIPNNDRNDDMTLIGFEI